MFSLLLFTACGEKEGADTADVSIDVLSAFESQLSGTFDSSQQAQEEPTYYDVSLTACPVSVDGIDTPTLYIEQAMTDSLNQPYRQRIYVLAQLNESSVQSDIYELDNPDAYIGTCGEEAIQSVVFDAMTLKEGCTVELEWNGEGFVGETDTGTCRSDMNGASYATSAVETTESMISSWDQGWNSSDQQVWGAVDGPYIFLRK